MRTDMRTDFDVTGSWRSTLARLDLTFRSKRSGAGRHFVWLPLLMFVVVVFATAAHGEAGTSTHDGELERWVFSGALEVGLHGDSAEAAYTASPLVGPRATNIGPADGGPNVVDAKTDENDVVSGLMGANLEVMTPGLRKVPSHPRLFLDVSLLGVLASEASIVRNGDVGEFGLPDDISFSAPFVGELFVEGNGVDVTSQHQGMQLYVGLGSAFTFDFGEERIRIKPSVVYSRTETKVSAAANRAVRIVNQDPIVNGRRVRSLDSFRLLSLGDNQTEVYHGLGPAVEIEYDTKNRFGPFLLSLFLKGGATHLFGDLETEFVASNPEYPEERVRWRYKNDSWAYRATTGMRFRFVPKSMK